MSRMPPAIAISLALILLAGCSSTAEVDKTPDVSGVAIEPVTAPESLRSLDPVSSAPAARDKEPSSGVPPVAAGTELTPAEAAFVASAPPSPPTSTSRQAVYGPGVTDRVIRIGAPVIPEFSELNAWLYPEALRPDFERVWEVVEDAINSAGGILGRRLKVIVYPEGPSAEQVCTRFTEEEPVIAVIGYAEGASCLDRAGVATINHAYSLEPEFYRKAPHALSLLGISFSRATRLYIKGLHAQGFFKGDPKIGLVRWDVDPFRSVARDLVRPMLASYGLEIDEELVLSNPNSMEAIPETQAEGRAGVQRFKDAGIDRVLTLDSGSYILPELTDYAQTLEYFPRYGVNSLNGGEWDMNRNQLKGAVGVGWMPWQDLEPKHAYRHGSDGARRCKDLMDAAGESRQMDTYNEAVWTSMICDGALLLKAAIEAGAPDITADSIIAGAESLGTSFQTSNTLLTRYGPGRHEAVAAFRFVRWFVGCQCFRYTSGLFDAG